MNMNAIRKVILRALLVGALVLCAEAQINPASLMSVSSKEFSQGGDIPKKYTCEGQNVSPPLKIERLPEAAKSVVLIMEDVDAPETQRTNWIVWNGAPDASGAVEFGEGGVPRGAIQGRNSFGKTGYNGPCPQSSVHRYYIRAYALNCRLALPAGAPRAALEKAMAGHLLNSAQLSGNYARK